MSEKKISLVEEFLATMYNISSLEFTLKTPFMKLFETKSLNHQPNLF